MRNDKKSNKKNEKKFDKKNDKTQFSQDNKSDNKNESKNTTNDNTQLNSEILLDNIGTDESFYTDILKPLYSNNILNYSEKIKIFISEKYKNLLPGKVTFDQLKNLERLPGLESIIGLPDLHHGYCFSIGPVVTTQNTVVPEGVGSDINCGVRIIKTNLKYENVDLKKIMKEIYEILPVGLAHEKQNQSIEHCLSLMNSGLGLQSQSGENSDRSSEEKSDQSQSVEKKTVQAQSEKNSAQSRNKNSEKNSVNKKSSKNSQTHKKRYTKMDFINGILDHGVQYLINHNLCPDNKDSIESEGKVPGDSNLISQKAKTRGIMQMGSLGSGNHFLEFQKVDKVYDSRLGLEEGQLVIMIHTGSRGLGHVVCSEAIENAEQDEINSEENVSERETESNFILKLRDGKISADEKEKIRHQFNQFKLNRNQKKTEKDKDGLPKFFRSDTATKNYLLQMGSATNFAFANRALINLTVEKILKKYGIETELIYDCGHNSLYQEEFDNKILTVHRKGASRALPKGHPALSEKYREIGQPVPVGGSMGTASYLLLSKETGQTRFSCPHGSGRVITRTQAKAQFTIADVQKRMGKIILMCKSSDGAIEEHPEVYKDIDLVIGAAEQLGLVDRVVRLTPLGVIKG